ncbi:MAG: ABC transporter C-terminal domain-containing protein, partial [Treponema sp.]|nr:ABC transporter C-terminal domain-containing protein [Treponema sp.]
RGFMEELSTKTLGLSPQMESEGIPAAWKLYYGNYAYYLERTKNDLKRDGNEARAIINEEPAVNSAQKRVIDKQNQAAARRLEKQEAELLKTIEELEKKKTYLEVELALPDVYSNGEKTREVKQKLSQCAKEIEIKTHEWEETVKKLEK